MRAEITVRNIGTSTIEGAKVFGKFSSSAGDVSDSTYLSPLELPVGSLASGSLLMQAPPDSECQIVTIQDRRGNPLL